MAQKRVDVYPVDVWTLIHWVTAFLLCFILPWQVVVVLVFAFEVAEHLWLGKYLFKWNISGRYETLPNVIMDVVYGLIGVLCYLNLP